MLTWLAANIWQLLSFLGIVAGAFYAITLRVTKLEDRVVQLEKDVEKLEKSIDRRLEQISDSLKTITEDIKELMRK